MEYGKDETTLDPYVSLHTAPLPLPPVLGSNLWSLGVCLVPNWSWGLVHCPATSQLCGQSPSGFHLLLIRVGTEHASHAVSLC